MASQMESTSLGAAAVDGAAQHHVVDVGPVEVEAVDVGAGQLGQLAHRADARVVACRATPDGEGRAPVTIPRKGPVDVVLEPVAEASVLDVPGMPADALVLPQQIRLSL